MDERASAILEEIKALPISEREAFATMFDHWKTENLEKESSTDEPAWPDFAGRIKALFGDRTIPGDPQEFWDEERGK